MLRRMTPAFYRCADRGAGPFRLTGLGRRIVGARPMVQHRAPVRAFRPGYPLCPDCEGGGAIFGAHCAYCDGFGRVALGVFPARVVR